MQSRQTNRNQYFEELALTCRKYFLPYVERFVSIGKGLKVLEIGCGDGGNLQPFSERGCEVLGVDMAVSRIEVARKCFERLGLEGQFVASDIFEMKELEGRFNLIICHDVIEHILDKSLFLSNMKHYLAPEGLAFISFPAWQMPFGGHQQICRGKFLSHLPFFHLLPKKNYKELLVFGGEGQDIINELLCIKETRCPIELFLRRLKETGFEIVDKKYWFINPHYEIKFGLKPRKLSSVIASLPWIRNFFTTSTFFIISPKKLHKE